MNDNQELGCLYLNPEDLQNFFWASLSERGHKNEPTAWSFRQAITWYIELYSKGWDSVPFFFVYDLGLLLMEANKFQFRNYSETDVTKNTEEVNAQISRRVTYQNRILNRFLALPVFSELHDFVVESKNPKLQIAAILSYWLEPIKKSNIESVQTSAQILRQLTSPAITVEEARVAVEQLLEAPNYFYDQLEEVIRVMSETHLSNLIQPEDIFIIKNIEALSSDALRLSAKQVVGIEQQMGDVDHPPVHMRKEAPQAHVNLSDVGLYPQGGLDQLSNRGSIENLVRTELAYVDDKADIDMFTMRYLEGELLYYTRDEAQLLRRNRTTHISLEFGHAHHIKYPNHPTQMSILLRAMTARLIDDLFKLFANDSLKVILHIHDIRSSDAVELWKIRFKDQLTRSDMQLNVVNSPPFANVKKKDFKALQEETAKYIDTGRYSTLIRISPLEPLSNEELSLAGRQGLNILHLQCPFKKPAEKKEDVPTQQKFIGVTSDDRNIIESLHEARKYLLWTLLGC
jgi:hypothetical protein